MIQPKYTPHPKLKRLRILARRLTGSPAYRLNVYTAMSRILRGESPRNLRGTFSSAVIREALLIMRGWE